MTCINKGQEPWLKKANVLDPASCPDPKPSPCPDPPPGPFGPGWEVGPNDCPAPPINVEVVSPLFTGTLDIRWDNPAILTKNTNFEVVGVNIYRSNASERGPYERLNMAPVGGTFYRDFTDNAFVEREIVDWETSWLSRGEQSNNRKWSFRTKHFPIVKKSGQSIAANSPMDVELIIDNRIVPVQAVFGPTGEVTLVNVRGYDFATERWTEPVLPLGPQTEVAISYYWNKNTVRTDLDKKSWYRVTTVARNPKSPTGFLETPLDFAEPATFRQVERLDYIWREAIRRNNWILEQGGERAKVFIRKTAGDPCRCRRDPRTLEFIRQPVNRCGICFGTGFAGGYEGPYDIIISPDDAERSVRQAPTGRFVEHVQDVWTGPSPMLSQRDFVVKQTGERYSIGPIRKPSARGNVMQQHFQIKYLDEQDIRYQIPLFDTTALCWPECRGRPAPLQGGQWQSKMPPLGPYPVGADYQQTPMQTEKDNIPDEREQRGRTPVWKNTMY